MDAVQIAYPQPDWALPVGCMHVSWWELAIRACKDGSQSQFAYTIEFACGGYKMQRAFQNTKRVPCINEYYEFEYLQKPVNSTGTI
ncbi:hypothetical protein GOBAR_DD35525 [Gossypium barbadense]|nr:hypothetical protein GOBAR_DD35525 [Gossypium barbadense]